MITVEGLDNTGKTTLVERIRNEFPQLKHNPSIGNKHVVEQIRQQMYSSIQVDRFYPLTLWDRSRIISEYVYNPVLRGRPLAVNFEEWWQLFGEYLKQPQLIIYCHRPLVDIQKSFDDREQLGGVAQNLGALNLAYEHVMDWIDFIFRNIQPSDFGRLVRYNWKTDSYSKVRASIEKYLEVVDR